MELSIMKKTILYALLFAVCSLPLASCSDDDPNSTSVIVPEQQEKTIFDKWLDANFVEPYNIQFKYRYESNESDMDYYTVPANFDNAVVMAHMLKYLCIEAYDETAGVDFTRAHFPKLFFCMGEFEYRNNGTMILGTAENGKKILLAGANHVSEYIDNPEMLNELYFKTIHHEFTHILNQTKEYPTNFKFITATDYVGDSWSTETFKTPAYFATHGFITAYAQHSDTEDFAEMLSVYVVNDKATWDAMVARGGEEGAALINSKLDIVRAYMQTKWNVDIDQLRDAIQRRQADVISGKISLTDLTVKK
jgi:substrate import-associated zinc metallohydrolase lipoprotein